VREIAPAQPARERRQRFGMRGKPRAIGLRHRFRAAKCLAQAAAHVLETDAAGKWKIFFRRINDVHKVAGQPRMRKPSHYGLDFSEGRKEIAEPYELRIAACRRIGRKWRIAGVLID